MSLTRPLSLADAIILSLGDPLGLYPHHLKKTMTKFQFLWPKIVSSPIAWESPAPTAPLPNEELARLATYSTGKRLSIELDALEGSNPCTPVPSQKCTKSQAKWAKQLRTRSVTKPLPSLQETPVSPISISSEEEQVEPIDDIQSPHPPPSTTEESPKSFPEEY